MIKEGADKAKQKQQSNVIKESEDMIAYIRQSLDKSIKDLKKFIVSFLCYAFH